MRSSEGSVGEFRNGVETGRIKKLAEIKAGLLSLEAGSSGPLGTFGSKAFKSQKTTNQLI